MKIIILGASGMIGSTLFSYLRESHEVMGTLRLNKESYDKFEKLNLDNIIYDLDVRDIWEYKLEFFLCFYCKFF